MGGCISSDATGTPDERAKNKAIDKDLRDVRSLPIYSIYVSGSLAAVYDRRERKRARRFGFYC